MTIATKNGSIIVKDGLLAENCDCCGGWYCYTSPCVNSTIISRATMWACGEDYRAPDSINVSITFSGLKRYELQQASNGWRCVEHYADKSYDATHTLTRQIWTQSYQNFSNGHCYYEFMLPSGFPIRVTPGVPTGLGWDAALYFDPVFNGYSRTVGQLIVTQSKPSASLCGGSEIGFSNFNWIGEKNFRDGFREKLSPDYGFALPEYGQWSNSQQPQLSFNPTLAGISWTYFVGDMQVVTIAVVT